MLFVLLIISLGSILLVFQIIFLLNDNGVFELSFVVLKYGLVLYYKENCEELAPRTVFGSLFILA